MQATQSPAPGPVVMQCGSVLVGQLPDMLGTDLVRALSPTLLAPFVLISAFLTTKATVEAMNGSGGSDHR